MIECHLDDDHDDECTIQFATKDAYGDHLRGVHRYHEEAIALALEHTPEPPRDPSTPLTEVFTALRVMFLTAKGVGFSDVQAALLLGAWLAVNQANNASD